MTDKIASDAVLTTRFPLILMSPILKSSAVEERKFISLRNKLLE